MGDVGMYFEKAGKINTQATLELAMKTAQERGIDTIVVASNTGETALPLKDFSGRVVCVTHVDGFAKPGENELTEEMRAKLTEAGILTVTAGHALSGVERGLSRKFSGVYPAELIAYVLRMFGQGTKVCVEISIMALDAGTIPFGKPVVAVGGSGRGADTAVILTPGYSSSVLETKIHEVICKPYNP